MPTKTRTRPQARASSVSQSKAKLLSASSLSTHRGRSRDFRAGAFIIGNSYHRSPPIIISNGASIDTQRELPSASSQVRMFRREWDFDVPRSLAARGWPPARLRGLPGFGTRSAQPQARPDPFRARSITRAAHALDLAHQQPEAQGRCQRRPRDEHQHQVERTGRLQNRADGNGGQDRRNIAEHVEDAA